MSRAFYHLIFRFVASEWFIKTNLERDTYLQLLGEALQRSDWHCFAYAIMSNHIHLGMAAGRSSRTPWLRHAHSPFGEWINRRNDRIGSVFVKKPTTVSVARDDVARVIAYIHNNPVRAGVVARARDSTWTSHNAYVGSREPQPWLRVDIGFDAMHIKDAASFEAFVDAEASQPRQDRRGKSGRPPSAHPRDRDRRARRGKRADG